MNPERWQQIKGILTAALEHTPEERPAWVRQACDGDEDLWREVESLLARHQETDAPFDWPLPASAGSDQVPPVPERIGPYRVLREIGRGGMGMVCLAERDDDEYRRQVAVKLLKRGMDTDEIVRRFRAERQILAQLDHPNIARLYEGGTAGDGLPYFVMEHVEGEPLDRWCDTRKLSTRKRLELFLSVCSAVSHAHRNLVVHRDLKPGNILVTPSGEPKLLDFGIAKLLDPEQSETLTALGLRPMTPEYASPEQVRGEAVTTATDVYSLGVVLYELLTGHRPYRFPSRAPEQMSRVICESEPEKPSTAVGRSETLTREDGAAVTLSPEAVSATRDGEPGKLRRRLAGDLDTIVLTALAKEPGRRYGSVERFAEDIERHLEQRPVRARRPTFLYRAEKFLRRNRLGVGIAAALLLLLVGFGTAMATQYRQTARQRDRAEWVTRFMVELFEVSSPHQGDGGSVTARALLDEGVEKIRQGAGQEDPEVRAELLHTMGVVYLELALFDPAAPLLEEAYELRRKLLGDEHPATAETLNALAGLAHHRGEYEQAEDLYLEALETRRTALGERSPEVASTLASLGALYSMTGEYEKSEALLLESIDIKEALPTVDAASLALSHNDLAYLYNAQERYGEAETFYEKALEILENAPVPDNMQLATSLHSLAVVYSKQGRFGEAEGAYRKTLPVLEAALGPEHPTVAASLNSLGALYLQTERPEEAETLFRQAIEIREKTQGRDHPDLGTPLSNLALALKTRGEYGEAEAQYRRALEIKEASLGHRHRSTAVTLTNLADLTALQGNPEEAETLYLEALDIKQEVLEPDSPSIANTLRMLAKLYRELGRFREAEPLYRRAVAIREQAYGPEHRWTLDLLDDYAALLREMERSAEAEELEARVAAIRGGQEH